MANRFSIPTGTTIGIAAVAYQSTTRLSIDIALIEYAPKALWDLGSDLRAMEHVLSKIQLEPHACPLDILTTKVQDGVRIAISDYKRACDQFQALLREWRKHLSPSTTGWWDLIRVVLFGEAYVQIFRQQVFQSKETLLAAINTAKLIITIESMDVVSETQDKIENHERNLNKVISDLRVTVAQVRQQQQLLPEPLLDSLPAHVHAHEDLISETQNGLAVLTSYGNILGELISATARLKKPMRFNNIHVSDDSRAIFGTSTGNSHTSQSFDNISVVRGGRAIIGVAHDVDYRAFFNS